MLSPDLKVLIGADVKNPWFRFWPKIFDGYPRALIQYSFDRPVIVRGIVTGCGIRRLRFSMSKEGNSWLRTMFQDVWTYPDGLTSFPIPQPLIIRRIEVQLTFLPNTFMPWKPEIAFFDIRGCPFRGKEIY